MPNTDHAPDSACFRIEEMTFERGKLFLRGLNALKDELERDERDAMSSHNAKREAQIHRFQHQVGLTIEWLNELMEEAALEFVPSQDDRAESEADFQGDMAREDRSAA